MVEGKETEEGEREGRKRRDGKDEIEGMGRQK